MRKKRNWSIFGNSWKARKYRKLWYWKTYFERKRGPAVYNHGTRIW